ncbi:B-box zinc finger domain containing protein [Cryptosporidium ryanae]|uniref:B-box zinc finger domain containing protein n=1 Tax=Cryptosporidium ryanae TaxID=515981 RepID=UPI00351AAD2D|nr:B-box zinc finger domain containing protein [Cryptosporidium ryanae]
MLEEKVVDIVPELIDDAFVLARCEYMIQLSFYTPDLHITRAWSLITREQRESFNRYASNLGGHVIQSIYDLSELPMNQNFETIFGENKITINSKKMIFKNGALPSPSGFDSNPMGIYRFVVFTLALGPILIIDEADGMRSSIPFPPGYMCKTWQNPNVKHVPSTQSSFTANYQVKFCDQILPTMIVEVEFKPLRIEISQPICEMCEINISTLYCESDKAHLCVSCDEYHHSSSRLLSKHRRVPVSQSPYQFGFCPHHSTERIDSVCMNCYIPLCPHCILIGQHSSGDAAEHILISTTDAIRMAYSGISQSDLELHKRKSQLVEYLSSRHNHINDIRSNYDDIQERIELASKSLLQQLIALREKKMSFIMSIKRQLLTELLLIEWMEAFFAHLRLALLPSDFLVYSHRHDLVCSHFFGGNSNILVNNNVIPSWVQEKFFVDGGFNVISRSNETSELLDIFKIEQDENANGLSKDDSHINEDENIDSLNKKALNLSLDSKNDLVIDSISKYKKNATAKWNDFDHGDLNSDNLFNLSGKNLPVEQKLLTSDEYNSCKLPKLSIMGIKESNESLLNDKVDSEVKYPVLRKTKLIPQMKDLVNKIDGTLGYNDYYGNSSALNYQNNSDELLDNIILTVKSKLDKNKKCDNDSDYVWSKIKSEADDGDKYNSNTKKVVDNIINSRTSAGSNSFYDKTVYSYVWDPSVEKPIKLTQKYWGYLVSNNYELLIALLHSAPVIKRKMLIQDIFNISIYMQTFDHLFYSLLHFEINFLSNIPIDTMLVSSSTINDFFHTIFRISNLNNDEKSFLVQQMQISLLNILNLEKGPYTDIIGKKIKLNNNTDVDENESKEDIVDRSQLDEYQILFEENIYTIVETFIRHLVSIDIKTIPNTIRGVMYGIIDTIDSISSDAYLLKSENKINKLPSKTNRVTTYCTNGSISFCCQVLLNHYIVPRLSNIISSINYSMINERNNGQYSEITEKNDIVARIQCFRRAISGISIYVWEPTINTPRETLNNTEAKYRQLGLEIFAWMQNIFTKPRLNSPIIFSLFGMPKRGINSTSNIKDYMMWLDNALRNDELKSEGGMTKEDILRCEHFENLLSLAFKGMKG